MNNNPLSNFRKQYPQYNDVPDMELAQKLAEKYPDAYGNLPSMIQGTPEAQNVSADEINPSGIGFATPQEKSMSKAFFVGAEKGLGDIGRGIGLSPQLEEKERAKYEQYKQAAPFAFGAGEMGSETLPFLPIGMGVGLIPSLGARIAGSGLLGAVEGGILAAGEGTDTGKAIMGGGAIGVGSEILFPVIGGLGSKLITKVTGRSPKGALLDLSGRPTRELQEALDQAGLTYDDLTNEAKNIIFQQEKGVNPEQVARLARATEEGIPLTKGEVTQDFGQLAVEQRMLGNSAEEASEGFRQWKLNQSEAIKEALRKNLGVERTKDETGTLIYDALTGRKELLRTQKNELYKQAADKAKNIGGVPLFTDNISKSLPDDLTMQRIQILDPEGANRLNSWLQRFGIIPYPENSKLKPEILSLENFDNFRVGLNQISKSSDAINVAVNPLKRALDEEADNIVSILEKKGANPELLKPLIEARKTVRQLKTEFSPKSLIGQLTDTKSDNFTRLTQASQVYDKIVQRSVAPEQVSELVSSLRKGGTVGKNGLEALQASVLLDLIDSGFTTESRKISGVNVFNPVAFRRRMNMIGKDKIFQIFKTNPKMLSSINNIEKIAKDLIPPDRAVPKGSADAILDLAGKIGFTTLNKIPFGNLVGEGIRKVSISAANRKRFQSAIAVKPEIIQTQSYIKKMYPNIASAFGIASTIESQED